MPSRGRRQSTRCANFRRLNGCWPPSTNQWLTRSTGPSTNATRRRKRNSPRSAGPDGNAFEPVDLCKRRLRCAESAQGAQWGARFSWETAILRGFPALFCVWAGTRVAPRVRLHTEETSIPVLDDRVLSELQTLGADVVAEICGLFVVDVPNRLGRLQQAVDTRSPDGVLREVHGLKGSALGVGASRLAVLCAAIEHDARDGHFDQAAARSAELEGEFARVRDAMKDKGVAGDAHA